jgi:hypothetical protein
VPGVVALATVAVVLAALAVVPGANAQTPTTPLRVSMYGDSVMLGAKDELLAQFAGQPVTVDAVEDRSLLGAVGLFQSAGPALGDVVVLDLGYNDASDPTVFRGRIDDAMAALAGVRHVFWLNQHDWGPGRAGMNAELVAAQSRYPNLQVIDWNAEVTAHPDEVYADSIHLTPSGQTAMATLVRQAYDGWVASLTPTTTTTAPPSTTANTPHPTAAPRASAASTDDGDPGGGRHRLLLAVGVVVLLLVLGTVLSVGRRSARRAGRGERRGR